MSRYQEGTPCESEEDMVAHVHRYRIEPLLLTRMHELTQKKRRCFWLWCPVFESCDGSKWHGEISLRAETEDIIRDLLPLVELETIEASVEEQDLIRGVADKMASFEKAIPTERQMAWLRAIHERQEGR